MVICRRSCIDLAIDSASLDMVALPSTNGALTRSVLISGMGLASLWKSHVAVQEQRKCSKQPSYGYMVNNVGGITARVHYRQQRHAVILGIPTGNAVLSFRSFRPVVKKGLSLLLALVPKEFLRAFPISAMYYPKYSL